jgi:hypothetical protein
MTALTGNYFTRWQYDANTSDLQMGPIIVIGADNSVLVDGVLLKQALVSTGSVSWFSGLGNPSSALLQFSQSSDLQAMTFTGVYWLADEPQPSSNNFFGFNSQPSTALTAWNNVYHCYQLINGTREPAGELVVSSPLVTYNGKSISSAIYTGYTYQGNDSNELAWYTKDGNDDNVAISFFHSTDDPGVLLFNGCIWAADAQRLVGAAGSPETASNFFGSTQDKDQVDNDANHAHHAQTDAATVTVTAVVAAAAMNAAGIGGAAKIPPQVLKPTPPEEPPAEEGVLGEVEQTAEDIAVEGVAALALNAVIPAGHKAIGLSARELLDLRSKW